ncbi:MAG: amidohydrolase family protein [Deltaproteobacteria bacterium]|nr:amidohydrolase family protein [Deltaproteobacteria bacterium]MBW2389967.1 amidohydrolase family protein [Deltaproteobacteria bacterium]
MHDLVIRNGTVVDGSGGPAFRADVAIDGERISAIGDVTGSAWRTLDAEGRIVTPGFVDAHTHLDAQLMWDPLGTPACWQGITTVVVGNCGVTFAPVRPGDHELLARTLESVEEIPAESIMASLNWRWETFGEYLTALDASPLGVNVGGLIGHASTRFYAMGAASVEEGREPTARELTTMQGAIDEAIGSGALGFSTSRTRSHATPEGAPIPGTFASDAEIFALAEVLGKRGRGLVQWVAGFGEQDSDDAYPEARREVARIAETHRRSGRPVVFSMFTHELVPTLHSKILDWTAEERTTGADIRPMFNPRAVLSFIGLHNRSPIRSSAWKALYERPSGERLAALEDSELRAQLTVVSDDANLRAGSELYLFGPEKCEYERRPERSLGNVAAAHGETPAETVVRLFRETRGRQLFAATGSNHNPDHIEEILDRGDPLIGLGDAGAHVTAICDSSLTTHLLTYWCRERKKFSLEEAVRRITSDPAEAFGIRERGRLQAGFFADVNVIDLDGLTMEVPEFVHDFPCGAGRWTQRARGYDFTVVNGQIAIEGGRHTGRLVGQVVRGSGTNTA